MSQQKKKWSYGVVAAALTGVLMVTGARDPFGKGALALAEWFRASGAELDLRTVDAGHDLVADDEALARQWWLRENGEGHG